MSGIHTTRGTQQHYAVCLDCGKRFSYDWAHMKLGKAIPHPAHVPTRAV